MPAGLPWLAARLVQGMVATMSRLQEAVDAFAADWLARTGRKPGQDTISNGTFSRSTGQPFCLCYKPMAALINFEGLSCADCLKPVTSETSEWYDEARAERRQLKETTT